MTDHAGPINLYFCERHARIALERYRKGERNVEGHLAHVVFRLQRELKHIEKMLGKKDWRIRLRRGKYR